MRRLLLIALIGMALSKAHFGSFVPPELKFKAPGFDMLKDGANAPKPRWFTHPAHLHPAWMQSCDQPVAPKASWLTSPNIGGTRPECSRMAIDHCVASIARSNLEVDRNGIHR